jgi:hypothetical protein
MDACEYDVATDSCIEPPHSDISRVQITTDQYFHDVVTKLDGQAAAVNSANRILNSIGQILATGCRKLPVGLIPTSGSISSLEQSLDDSCYTLPEVENEEGWLMFSERESNQSADVKPAVKCHESKAAMTTESSEVLGGSGLAKDVGVAKDVVAAKLVELSKKVDLVNDTEVAKDTAGTELDVVNDMEGAKDVKLTEEVEMKLEASPPGRQKSCIRYHVHSA